MYNVNIDMFLSINSPIKKKLNMDSSTIINHDNMIKKMPTFLELIFHYIYVSRIFISTYSNK